MALPNQLKSARITGASSVSAWPTACSNIETAICDILGIPIDTNVSTAVFGVDSSGHIINNPISFGAPPIGRRFRDSSNAKEFRFVIDQQSGAAAACIDENTGTELAPAWNRRVAWQLSTGAQIAGSLVYGTVTDSALVNNTNVVTNFNRSYTIPANTLVAGTIIRVFGKFNVPNLTSGSMNIGFTLGAVGVDVYSAVTATGDWPQEAYFTIRTSGASGTYQSALMAPTSVFGVIGGSLGGGTSNAIDTTASRTLNFWCQPAFSSPNNSCKLTQASIEIMIPTTTQ